MAKPEVSSDYGEADQAGRGLGQTGEGRVVRVAGGDTPAKHQQAQEPRRCPGQGSRVAPEGLRDDSGALGSRPA